jgi:hypothetical protein
MEINIVGEANESNGHPSQESDVTVNAENSNVDEPDIIYDRSKTIDTIAEQTEYLEKNYQFNPFMLVRKSIQLIRLLM